MSRLPWAFTTVYLAARVARNTIIRQNSFKAAPGFFVNTAMNTINHANPSSRYKAVLLLHVFSTINQFKGYDNTLAFFATNKVINDLKTISTATHVKSVVRDIKHYINKQRKRYIPVGYSATDIAENCIQTAQYLNYGDDKKRYDFFFFNNYGWSGDSSYSKSGYDQTVKNFTVSCEQQ